MNENAVEGGIDFDALEEKVNRAVEMIRRLKESNRKLGEENARLSLQVESSGGASRETIDGLTSRLAALEKEKTTLQDDRRILARRIEDALSKLEFLESESVPH